MLRIQRAQDVLRDWKEEDTNIKNQLKLNMLSCMSMRALYPMISKMKPPIMAERNPHMRFWVPNAIWPMSIAVNQDRKKALPPNEGMYWRTA